MDFAPAQALPSGEDLSTAIVRFARIARSEADALAVESSPVDNAARPKHGPAPPVVHPSSFILSKRRHAHRTVFHPSQSDAGSRSRVLRTVRSGRVGGHRSRIKPARTGE